MNVMFFFSSRRRHTRWPRDWSSDVCSSDLTRILEYIKPDYVHVFVGGRVADRGGPELAEQLEAEGYEKYAKAAAQRSEERRVGKECRSRRAPSQEKKKE